jgi:ketosteroid isomerase-like protein
MPTDAELRSQVLATLSRFNALVSARDMQVLAEFADGDDTLLVGSEVGEVASGRRELEAFFARVFARDTTFSWEWDRIDISHGGDVAWLFAGGRVVLTTAQGRRKAPYRITGVLERHGPRWLWRQYHGSEPAAGA